MYSWISGATGFPLHSDRLNELAQRLILSGICRRAGDVFRFSVPLLREAIAALDVRFRIDQTSSVARTGRPRLARAALGSPEIHDLEGHLPTGPPEIYFIGRLTREAGKPLIVGNSDDCP